jgi:DNA-binding MarR family transcriptional regulator
LPIGTEVAAVARVQSDGAVEHNFHLARLLMWLGKRPVNARFADVSDFAEQEGMSPEDAEVLVLELEQSGWVDRLRTGTGRLFGTRPFVGLTDEGRVEVRRLKLLQQDHAARHRYADDAFLKWLYATAHDQKPANPVGFLAAPVSYFAGDALSGEELHRAMVRVVQAGLAEEIDTDPRTVAITPDGIECVLSGVSVSDYTNRPRPGDTYNITDSQGVVAGSQQRVEQTNNFGLDAAALRDFAAVVQRFAPTFGMSDDQQAELIREAEVLAEATTGESPEPRRVRAAYERVRSGLAAITAVSAGLDVVVQQGEEAYRTVFGS